MARLLNDSEYYQTNEKSLPVKWCSPEVLSSGMFSVHSDCWSFGIALWELFTYGAVSCHSLSSTSSLTLLLQSPYTGMSNQETTTAVCSGHRLECPKNCPNEIFQIMSSCWNAEPKSRPS